MPCVDLTAQWEYLAVTGLSNTILHNNLSQNDLPTVSYL
ncbi:hypothetical protein M23134_08252 [Microscilla marina ATCC 23134]|uniref:Uncharacterized protein n=1 Tax=Microscilla marina ATCC 23134 TaxID=313606 RepID=A1ZHF4_MICM2|nr:hypothetical protein M23134_08252 [Microscilla marina ATCC 23134]